MSLWVETLRAAVLGEHESVHQLLGVELPSHLRWPAIANRQDVTAYDGPCAKAVLNFIKGLGETDEAKLARSRVDDFIDFVTDQVMSKIERTVRLAAFCANNPNLGINDIATHFDGWAGLKRNSGEKLTWVQGTLASMCDLGIVDQLDVRSFREISEMVVGQRFGFSERALMKMWNVRQSWVAFKEIMEISYEFEAMDNGNDQACAESFHYKPILRADSIFQGQIAAEQKSLEMMEVAAKIGQKLEGNLQFFDLRKPRHGYRPIAWHKVWWDISDKYAELNLSLHLELPCCDTDQVLADHIIQFYANDCTGVNRLNVQRRRQKLFESCDADVIEIVLDFVITI